MVDPILLGMYLVPVAASLIAIHFWHTKITPEEGLIMFVVTTLLITCVWGIGRYSGTGDYEVWNGEITNKDAIQQSCPWGWRSYQDSFCTEYRTRTVKVGESCTRDEKGNQSCTPIYDTEYKYIYDWERRYFVRSNVKNNFEVSRIDRQGVKTPPFYQSISVGDPASSVQPYKNWLRAAANNIYSEDGVFEEKYKDFIPEYPIKMHDVYKINRVVAIGDIQYPKTLNNDISVILKELGPQRQMNFVLILVDAKVADSNIAYAIRKKWKGFKKNDAVAVIGLDGDNVQWTSVFSWSKKSIFDIQLRDAILEMQNKPIDYPSLMASVQKFGMESYERRSMKEFEYLKDDIPVSLGLTITGFMVSLLASIGLLYWFSQVDIRFFNNKRR